MLRLTVGIEDYIQINDDIKIIFLGGSQKNMRVMIDAPKDVNIARSKAIEKRISDPEGKKKLPKYYAQQEHPEKYVRKKPLEP